MPQITMQDKKAVVNSLNPVSWIDQLLQASPAYQTYQQQQEQVQQAQMPPTAEQAGQVAGQQVAPPQMGPIKSIENTPDGGTKTSYHPPVEPQAPNATQSIGESASSKPGESKAAPQPSTPGVNIVQQKGLGKIFGQAGYEQGVNGGPATVKMGGMLDVQGGKVAQALSSAGKSQEMTGQQPIQPLEALSAKAGIYSTQLSSFDKQIEDEKASQTAMLTEQQNLIRNRILGMGTPANVARYKQLQQELDRSRTRLFGDPGRKIKGLMDRKGELLARPPVVQSGMDKAQQKGQEVREGQLKSMPNVTWKLKK